MLMTLMYHLLFMQLQHKPIDDTLASSTSSKLSCGISYLASVYQYADVSGFYAREENGIFTVRLPFA